MTNRNVRNRDQRCYSHRESREALKGQDSAIDASRTDHHEMGSKMADLGIQGELDLGVNLESIRVVQDDLTDEGDDLATVSDHPLMDLEHFGTYVPLKAS